jgi:hypothetical protein
MHVEPGKSPNGRELGRIVSHLRLDCTSNQRCALVKAEDGVKLESVRPSHHLKATINSWISQVLPYPDANVMSNQE